MHLLCYFFTRLGEGQRLGTKAWLTDWLISTMFLKAFKHFKRFNEGIFFAHLKSCDKIILKILPKHVISDKNHDQSRLSKINLFWRDRFVRLENGAQKNCQKCHKKKNKAWKQKKWWYLQIFVQKVNFFAASAFFLAGTRLHYRYFKNFRSQFRNVKGNQR